jgi:hypothetical protein
MNQDIPESGNGPPVNLGMTGLQVIADPLRGFGEGLEIAQNRVLNQVRLTKASLPFWQYRCMRPMQSRTW